MATRKTKVGDTPKANGAPPAAKRKLTRSTLKELYAARRYLGLDAVKEVGLRLPIEVYFKDPAVAKESEGAGIDEDFTAPWEPGLRDGPTSARFAVVDYDATTNTLAPPATWSNKENCYCAPDGKTVLDAKTKDLPQYHQLSVWANIQNTLEFFESGFALGRRITWAFEGNRLIVVPHAGYGENAYYDRSSKSLQFYWFGEDDKRVFTCLSSDIVNHEFGHAVLDGLRPHYYESVNAQTTAFHEFFGDLTALIMAFRNNAFRRAVLTESNGDLDTDQLLAGLAKQFGEAVADAPYLRSANNKETMTTLAGRLEPHKLSEVMTGAMFDILKAIFAKHRENEVARWKAGRSKQPSDVRALADTVPRMQTLAFQPLDLLPPCSVTFRDYALAILRSQQVADPTDPSGYRELMIDCFIERGILDPDDKPDLLAPAALFRRPALDVFHPVEAIAASRGGAYRFLDDNRDKLLIPLNADLIVSEVIRASKRARDGRSLPDEIIVQYIWREEVLLEGTRFGRFAGERTTMLCGATMVLDENGNLIHWIRKPGSTSVGTGTAAAEEQAAGEARRTELLDTIAARTAAGTIGETIGGALGLLEKATPPFGFQKVDGTIRFQMAPHFSLHGDVELDGTGDRQWQISF
jgi:hypothetical protein